MRGAVPPLPQYVSMACCLVKHKDNFTFNLTREVGLSVCQETNIVGTNSVSSHQNAGQNIPNTSLGNLAKFKLLIWKQQ